MKIDPNLPLQLHQELVLCEDGSIFLFDGASTSQAALGDEESHFKKFCRSLDPNTCFISALIPNDADRDVFFRAREVAGEVGIHMQATVDTPESHRRLWENYKRAKHYSQTIEH